MLKSIANRVEISIRYRIVRKKIDKKKEKILMKLTNKDKTMINVYFEDELLAKIDKDADENVRTRKSQVEYIVKQYYKNIEG